MSEGGGVPGDEVGAEQAAVGAGESEGAHRSDDEARVGGGEQGVGEAPCLHLAGLGVFEEDVGAAEQAVEQLPPRTPVEVEGDAALVAVEVDELGRCLGIRRVVLEGAEGAGRLAFRRLDLDHVGAKIGEYLPGEGRGDVAPVLDDAHAGEEAGRSRVRRHGGHDTPRRGALQSVSSSSMRPNAIRLSTSSASSGA